MTTTPETVFVDHEDVVGADYSGRRLDKFTAVGSRFRECRFDRIRVGDASFGSGMEISEFVGCSFDRARLAGLGGYLRFVGCTFRNARLAQCRLDYAEFVDCVFTGRIVDSVFWGAPPPGADDRYAMTVAFLRREGRTEPPGYRELHLRECNEIRGNDFSGADLDKVSFRYGVDLTAQSLPSGEDYLYLPAARTAVLAALAEVAPEPDAEGVEGILRILQEEIEDGQEQLLIRPADFRIRGAIPPNVLAAADLLRRAAAR